MNYLVAKQTAGYLISKIKRWFWSKDDVRSLKSLARAKTPAAKIAKQLKRSVVFTQPAHWLAGKRP
jgi:hypothetical protein